MTCDPESNRHRSCTLPKIASTSGQSPITLCLSPSGITACSSLLISLGYLESCWPPLEMDSFISSGSSLLTAFCDPVFVLSSIVRSDLALCSSGITMAQPSLVPAVVQSWYYFPVFDGLSI